jgi:molecular chaperone HtpG
MKGFPMSQDTAPETFGFQAEVKQLLHLMVHSLYSNKEIFLRELISNASDANDKLRFEALGKPELLKDSADLEIRVDVDKEAKTLSVADTGIGMNRADIIEHLGTIAHSGTSKFIASLSGDQQKDSQLIGQFGVGFYSAFIVADEVEVTSRRAGDAASEGVRWVSDGQGQYTVETVEVPAHGTTVTLKLKDEAKEFLEPIRVRTLITKYSDHIGFPVKMRGTEEGAELESVNRAKALWARPRTEIEDDEYKEFYRHIAHDFAEPLLWSHNKVEGKREYTSLLYIPSVAPFDLWNREAPRGVKLYVQRVFISDQATQFLPLYLRFIRGVVDSGDLSLNVSRELLQEDATVSAIRGALTKRVLDMIGKLASDEDKPKFQTFWEQFGAVLKEGLAEDHANRDKIASLLRFNSTVSSGNEQDRSLSEYLAAAKEGQDVIYYLVADSAAAAKSSPHLEAFRERGIEVLLLSDRIDEWAMQYLTEFEGKSFRDITRGELDLGDADKEDTEPAQADEEHKDLLERLKESLQGKVAEVRVSRRLKESAACIVLSDQDLGFQMRELLKATGQEPPPSLPNFEINVAHPLIERLGGEQDAAKFERLASVIFDQATLAEGRQLDDPAGFVKRLNELLLEMGAPAG